MKKLYLFLVMLFGVFGFTATAQELSKYDYAPDYGYPLIEDVEQLSSPYTEPREGSLGALIGMPEVVDEENPHDQQYFWHSMWSGEDKVEPGVHYFQVEIVATADELTDILAFVFTRRNTNDDHPTKWAIYGTNDPDAEKEACTLLRECETPFAISQVTEQTELFEVFPHKSFKFIRFYCTQTRGVNTQYNDRGYFHLGTFQLYPTEAADEAAGALQRLLDLYDQVKDKTYVAGEFVGAIDASLVDEFNSTLEEVVAKGDDPNVTADECNALYEKLDAAYKACEAAGEATQFKPGYYYLMNAKSAHNATDPDGLHFYMRMTDSEVAGWAKMDSEDPSYVWKFTEAGVDEDGDTYYNMQNFYTGGYVKDIAVSTKVTLKEEPGNVYVGAFGSAKYYILVAEGERELHQEGHGGATSEDKTGNIVGWNDNANSASAWYIIPVDDATISYLENMKAQRKLDTDLSDLIDQATITYSQAFQYECYITDPETEFTEWELMPGAKDVTPESVDDFYSNASEACEHGKSWGGDGIGFAALIDGDLSASSFYHTSWHGDPEYTAYDEENWEEPAAGALPSNKHNLWMKLKEPVSEVGFVFYPRGNGGHTDSSWDSPRDIDVYGSHDGINWTLCAAGYDRYNLYEIGYNFKSSPTYGACPAYTGPIELGDTYQWVRFDVNASRRGVYFNLGELRVISGMKAVETSQAAQMTEATVKGLQDALAEAKGLEHATQAAISKLQSAYDAFKAEFADPSELGLALSNAKSLNTKVNSINELGVGEGIGYYSEEIDNEALTTAIEEADALINSGVYSKAQLAEALAKIEAATAAVNTALEESIQEEVSTDTWYQICYPTEDEYTRLGWTVTNGKSSETGNYLFDTAVTIATSKWDELLDAEDGLNVESNQLYALDASTLQSPDFSYWRFVPVGEFYALQNKATSQYMRIAGSGPYSENHTNPYNRASYNPTLFTVEGLGFGKVVLRSYDLDGTFLKLALHFALDDLEVVGWGAYSTNTNSAVELREAGSADDSDLGYFHKELREGQAYAFCFPAGASVLAGAKMYNIKGKFEVDDIYYVGLEEVTEVEAGEPVIVIAEGEYNEDAFTTVADFRLNGKVATVGGAANGLVGTFSELSAAAGDGTLTANTEFGNYWNIKGSRTVNALSAYIPSIQSLPDCDDTDVAIYLGNPNETAISSTNANVKVSAIYNMAGVRVGTTKEISTLKSGLYIIGGRKVYIP